MSMSRADHWRRAQYILEKEHHHPSQRERELAQVHATLAAAPAEVSADYPERYIQTPEGTFGPGGPSRIYGMTPGEVATALLEADGLKSRLEAALEELEAPEAAPSSRWAAAFIRERVLGGEGR